MVLMRRWIIGQKRSDVDSILLLPQAEILSAERVPTNPPYYIVTFVVPKDLEDAEVKAR